MRKLSVISYQLSVVLALAVLGLGSVADGADEPVLEIPYDGSQAFRGILNELKMEPLAGPEQLTDPSRSILIVLGDTRILDQVPDGLSQFIRDGGAVLIATDRRWVWQRDGRTLVEVAGETMKAPPGTGFEELADFPIMRSNDQILFGSDPALFQGSLRPDGRRERLTRIVTNRPSFLQSAYTIQAKIPTQGGLLNFATGDRAGHGRFLVLADHSIFINAMMVHPETQNFDFAFNCVEWLATGTPRRDRVLFVEDGQVQTKFDIPLVQEVPPLPPLDAFVPVINSFLSKLQKETHGFNTIVVPDAGRHALWVAGLTVVGVLGLACYGYIWLARARYRGEPGLSPLQNTLLRHSAEDPLLKQRQRALLASGNLWESARMLVRQEVPQLAGDKAPRVVKAGSWWRRRTIQRQVEWLWQVAGGSVPMVVSPSRFARLPAEIHALKAALASGEIVL